MAAVGYDLYKVPLKAIQSQSREILSQRLNVRKILFTDESIKRDWRGVLHLSGLYMNENEIDANSNCFGEVLRHWIEAQGATATLGQLQDILRKIDRYDAFYDTVEYLKNDAKNFFERSTEMSQPAIDTRFSGTSKEMCQPSVDLSFSERSNRPFLESSNLSFQNSVVDKSLSERPIERSQPSIDTSFTERSKRSIHRLEDQHLLTIQDVYFNHRGMKLPKYDALVLFIPKDEKYVELLFKRLKMFKLCTRDDILTGVVQTKVFDLIKDRCERVIAVITPDFLRSRECAFVLNYSQFLGIELEDRKIIPCVFESCDLSMHIKMLSPLYYKENSERFWLKLSYSIPRSLSAAILNGNNMSQQAPPGFQSQLPIQGINQLQIQDRITSLSDSENF